MAISRGFSPIIRKFAIQGHDVPATSRGGQDPFSSELRLRPVVKYGEEYADSLHEALDNVRMFRCRECGTVLEEDELTNHDCEEF